MSISCKFAVSHNRNSRVSLPNKPFTVFIERHRRRRRRILMPQCSLTWTHSRIFAPLEESMQGYLTHPYPWPFQRTYSVLLSWFSIVLFLPLQSDVQVEGVMYDLDIPIFFASLMSTPRPMVAVLLPSVFVDQ